MNKTAIVIGSGIVGIATAIRLVSKGYTVSVFEKNATPGGKINEFRKDGYRFDMGPSLFTLPQLVDELFILHNKNPRHYFEYLQLEPITRYFYPDKTVLNAWSNKEKFAKECEEKLGEPAENILTFMKSAEKKYWLSADIFLFNSLHSFSTYKKNLTLKKISNLHHLDTFRTMNQANESLFTSEKTVQFFNRYATYNGSDPYKAPATLNVIAHLEHNLGAWFIKGGMYALTQALFSLAKELGIHFHFNTEVMEILIKNKHAIGVRCTDGKSYFSEKVISNMDVWYTYKKLLSNEEAPEFLLKQSRSSSALIFFWGMRATHPQLTVHNLVFTPDYKSEFKALFSSDSPIPNPTVYIYISSKSNPDDAPAGHENWFVMVNVPPDKNQNWKEIAASIKPQILHSISQAIGYSVEDNIAFEELLTPHDIAINTLSHQGSLYGNSSNNMMAAFLRHPNFSGRLKNLYFCGGSVHPGGGIPLCLASAKIVTDQM